MHNASSELHAECKYLLFILEIFLYFFFYLVQTNFEAYLSLVILDL